MSFKYCLNIVEVFFDLQGIISIIIAFTFDITVVSNIAYFYGFVITFMFLLKKVANNSN